MSGEVTLRRYSECMVKGSNVMVQWIQKVTISGEMYGEDADGNRGQWREEIDEAIVHRIEWIAPKLRTEAAVRVVKKQIQKINDDKNETMAEVLRARKDDSEGYEEGDELA